MATKKTKKGKKKKEKKVNKEPEIPEELVAEEEEKVEYDDIVAIRIPEYLQKKLHCVPDVDLFPDKPWVCAPLDTVFDDIKENGRDSVFYQYQDELHQQLNEILITYEYFIEEEGEIYPGTHWVCITNRGKQIILDHLVRFYDEAVRKAEADNTITPRPWKSLGSGEEIQEVEFPQTRPLIRYEFFGQKSRRFDPPRFVAVDASGPNYKEIIRSDYHLPLDFTYLPFKHECIQVGIAKIDVETQVNENIPVNVCTHINAEIEGEEKRIWLENQQQDAITKENVEMQISQLVKSNAKKIFESIAYNQEYNTCQDDYDLLRSGEKLDVANPDPYKTYRSFKCLKSIRGTYITYIAWHPSISGIVAATYGKKLLADTKYLAGDSDDENFKGEEMAQEEEFDKIYAERLEKENIHLNAFVKEAQSLYGPADDNNEKVEISKKSIEFFTHIRKIINQEVKLQFDNEKENIEREVLESPLPYFDYNDYLYLEPPQFDDEYIERKAKEVKLTADPDELETASEAEYRAFLRRRPTEATPEETEEVQEEICEEEEENDSYPDIDKQFPQPEPRSTMLEVGEKVEEEGEGEGKAEAEADEEEEYVEREPDKDTYKIWSKGWNFGDVLLEEAFETHKKYFNRAKNVKGDLPQHPGNSDYFPKLNLKMGLYYKQYGPYKRTEKTYAKMAEEAKETLKRSISTESITGYGSAIMCHTKPSVRMKIERFGQMDSDNVDEVYRDMLKTIKEGHAYRDACEIAEVETRYRIADKKKDYPLYLSSGSIDTDEEVMFKMDLPRVTLFKRHYVIIWGLRTPDHPLMILESPQEVSCVKFCPIDGNFVVGGTVNGQLILWDIRGKLKLRKKTKLESIKKRLERETNKQRDDTDETDEDIEAEIEKHLVNDPVPDKIRTFLGSKFKWYSHDVKEDHVEWTAMSKLEYSHSGKISDIIWVPPTQKVVNGSFEQISETEDLSLQIISSGVDGTIRMWDMNLIPAEKQRSRLTLIGKVLPHADEYSYKFLDGVWKPIFTVECEFSRNLPVPLTTVIFDNVKFNYKIKESSNPDSDHVFYDYVREEYPLMRNVAIAGTVGGHLMKITWDGASGTIETDPDGEIKQKAKVEYSALIHDGPIVQVDRNRMVPDLALSVGGHTFAIWSLDNLKHPLKWKKYRDVLLSTGNWSVWRTSTFKIYRMDGVGEIWDLAVRSEACHLKMLPSAGFITTASEPTLLGKKPIICIGDSFGQLKLMTVPKYLSALTEPSNEYLTDLLIKQTENKLYLAKWRDDYLEITNTPKYTYQILVESEYDLTPKIIVDEALEQKSESVDIQQDMDFPAIEVLYEKEQRLNPSYVKKLSEKECKAKYFHELYKWYVRRRGYECRWVDKKDKELYEAEQEHAVAEMIKSKKIDFQDLYERMKPLLKHEKQLRTRKEYIKRMRAEADLIFKRKIEHIHLMNESSVNPFKKDERVILKKTDFQKAEEEIDICFGESGSIFERDLRKELRSYNLGPLYKYRDLEELSVNYREWMNDRSFLADKSTRWVRLRVYKAIKAKGLKCVEFNNRRYKYICYKYRARLAAIDELKKKYGEDYDPYWDIDIELPHPYVGKWIKDTETLPSEEKEEGKDEVESEEEDSEESIDFYGEKEEKRDEDEDDAVSVSSWINLEDIINGADVVTMSYQHQCVRRQTHYARVFEEKEEEKLEEVEDASRRKDIEEVGDNIDMESQLEETEDEDEKESKDKKAKTDGRIQKKRKIKTKYTTLRDEELEDELFHKSIQIFLGEKEEESPKDKLPFTLLPETSMDKIFSNEDEEEDKIAGSQSASAEDVKQSHGLQMGDETEEYWDAIESKIIGEPEYGESIPTGTSSPSDITDNHFNVIESSSESPPDEFDAEFGEFEELQNFYKYSQHARRFPFSIDESYLKEDYLEEKQGDQSSKMKPASTRGTILEESPLQQLLLKHSVTTRESSAEIQAEDKRLSAVD